MASQNGRERFMTRRLGRTVRIDLHYSPTPIPDHHRRLGDGYLCHYAHICIVLTGETRAYWPNFSRRPTLHDFAQNQPTCAQPSSFHSHSKTPSSCKPSARKAWFGLWNRGSRVQILSLTPKLKSINLKIRGKPLWSSIYSCSSEEILFATADERTR
jgi:hypothetical protein